MLSGVDCLLVFADGCHDFLSTHIHEMVPDLTYSSQVLCNTLTYTSLSHTTHPIATYRYCVTSILPNCRHKVSTPPLNAYQYITVHPLPFSSLLFSSILCNHHNHPATTLGQNATQTPHPWLHSYATAESSTIALFLAQALYTRVAAQSSYRCSATLIASIPSSAGASSQTPPPRHSANSVATRDINTNNEESRNVANSNVMTHNVGTGTHDEVVAWGNYCPAAMTVLVQVAQVYPATPIPRTLYPYPTNPLPLSHEPSTPIPRTLYPFITIFSCPCTLLLLFLHPRIILIS